jgi:hypothetical protein
METCLFVISKAAELAVLAELAELVRRAMGTGAKKQGCGD